MTGLAWAAIAAFVAVMTGLNRYMRRREDEGTYNLESSSDHIGLRRLLDFSREGWRGDGVEQRPKD